MSARVISRGTWLRGEYGIGDGPMTCQLPDGSGSSIPSHISFVEPFRPEWPICAPAAQPPCACINETIRVHASTCSSHHIPAHPGVIRPPGETHIISLITRPAPPRAREPRCAR